jgi:large subunit ribosomal protein L9
MTKLILTKDVDNLGGVGDPVEVKNGYAKNYLLPNGLAIIYTKNGELEYESIREARKARDIASTEAAEALVAKFTEATITIQAKVSESGKLFGSIAVTKIVDAINSALGTELTAKQVKIGEPIKTVGVHEVNVNLYKEVNATAFITVEGTDQD